MTPPALFELKTTILGHSSPVWVFRRKKIRFDLKIVICGFFRSPSPIWPKMPPKNIFLGGILGHMGLGDLKNPQMTILRSNLIFFLLNTQTGLEWPSIVVFSSNNAGGVIRGLKMPQKYLTPSQWTFGGQTWTIMVQDPGIERSDIIYIVLHFWDTLFYYSFIFIWSDITQQPEGQH